MIIENIKKFIFPSRCVICDEVLPYGDGLENEYLCNECRENIEFIKDPTCKKCGAMISDKNEVYCTRCKSDLHQNFDYGFGLLRYNDSVKESLHKIKYGGRKEYIYFYGKCIAKKYANKFKEINPDYLVPIPIHKRRLIKRNYNQASVIAYAISDELKKYDIDIPVNENLIFRTKNTEVLNKLDYEDRLIELNDAFYASDLSGIDKVILIDDIYTTGATIDKIAKVMKENGVNKLYFATIAIVDNL